MSALTDEVSAHIDRATEEERRVILAYLRQRLHLHPLEQEWSTTAELILTAIARSADITLRGVRGILAEAIFEEYSLPEVLTHGWAMKKFIGEQAYDFLIDRDGREVKIQVKLQRREKGETKEYGRQKRKALNCPKGTIYVVEVQKTRSGKKNGKATRPYRFGDFDTLAVNLQPETRDWKRFMYTVGAWLLPRKADPNLIEIMQPVPLNPDDYWTDELNTCISWVLEDRERRMYS
jgi:hypothetical protein